MILQVCLVLLMYAAWSTSFPFGKMALDHSPPIFLTGFRMFFAGIILLGWLFFKDRKSLKIGKKQIVPILSLSLLSIYLTNVLELWSMQYLSPVKACFIYGLSPFLTIILSYVHFGEKVTGIKIAGMLIGFLGFIPVLMLQTGSEDLLRVFSFLSLPDFAMIGAALFSVYGWVLLRIIVRNQTLSPVYANGYSMLIGGILSLIHSVFVDDWSPIPISQGSLQPFLIQVFAMILISNIICYNLYGYMLKIFTSTLLSFFGLFSPVFASFLSWIMVGEQLSWVIFLSTGIVSCGLFIVYRTEIKQGYIRKVEQELDAKKN